MEEYDKNRTKTVKLGPSLKQVFGSSTIPTPLDLRGTDGEHVFWRSSGFTVDLSVFCNWRFVNLDKAFREVVGDPTRTLHVYSSISAITMIGNKVRDLLREILYKRQGRGSFYFEPLHIQHIPIRNDVMETIETELAESETGALVNFGKGETILTLHFKKEP